MFRKRALLIVVLAAICSAPFSYWIYTIFEKTVIRFFVVYCMYFLLFVAIFASIYDIIHKKDVKSNKYMLLGGINGIVALTSMLKAFHNVQNNVYSNMYLVIVFFITSICFSVFLICSSKHEKRDSN